MRAFLCKKFQPKPRFHSAAASSSSWLIVRLLQLRRNASPARHFFSTDAPEESRSQDGKPKSGGCAPEKVEKTKTLLRNYDFTDNQISKLYTQRPQIFKSCPDEMLVSKLDYFRGIGLSNSEIPRFICSNPVLLTCSLQNQIVPIYNFIKSLLLSSDSDVVKIMKLHPRFLSYNVEDRIAPNISALRKAGVAQKHILYLLRQAPTALESLCLGENIKRATEMGFQPNKWSFVEAIRTFTGMSKLTWDKKMKVYVKHGLSEEEILKAFRLRPIFMFLSVGKIEQTMDFFVNKMDWQPAELVRNPVVLSFSLEKRTIPRCTLVRYLQGKGLLRKSISLSAILKMTEKDFLDEFVNKYENDVPRLMDIYLGKLSPEQPRLESNT